MSQCLSGRTGFLLQNCRYIVYPVGNCTCPVSVSNPYMIITLCSFMSKLIEDDNTTTTWIMTTLMLMMEVVITVAVIDIFMFNIIYIYIYIIYILPLR